jgi:hypothetical protein
MRHIGTMKKNLTIAMVSWLAMFVMLATSTTLAIWMGWQGEFSSGLTINTSNIYSEVDATFVGANIANYIDERGLIEVNVSDPDAPNYIANLRINIKYRGLVDGYIRVRFHEEWYQTTLSLINYNTTSSVTRNVNAPFVIAFYDSEAMEPSGWIDNRIVDDYLYYSEKVLSTSKTNIQTIPFITGFGSSMMFPMDDFTTPTYTRSYSLYLAVSVEAVQSSRYQAIWGDLVLPFL